MRTVSTLRHFGYSIFIAMLLVIGIGRVQAATIGTYAPGQPLDGRAHFLREVWRAACGPFTTVLGPEANRAHRNHFHVDLAQRKSGAFCQ